MKSRLTTLKSYIPFPKRCQKDKVEIENKHDQNDSYKNFPSSIAQVTCQQQLASKKQMHISQLVIRKTPRSGVPEVWIVTRQGRLWCPLMLYVFNALMLLLFDRPHQRRLCDVVSVIAFNQRKRTRRKGQSIVEDHGRSSTRWAPTSYEIGYDPYKWPKIKR